jgi:hypothetical protein
LATIKLKKGARSKTLLIHGRLLDRTNEITDLPVNQCLGYLGDSSLDVSFEEADRKELRELPPERLTRLSRALGQDLSTHDDLCALLLPAKAKAKKTLSKSKKSALTE